MSDYYGMGRVIGRPIASVDLADDGESLTFRFQDGTEQRYDAEGDCCSESWIEHLTVPSDIAGAVVTVVKEGDSVEATDALRRGEPIDYVDLLVKYQTAFVTDRGEIIVEYRNHSNGYYGGWLQARDS